MAYSIFKIIFSAVTIFAVSEVAKRGNYFIAAAIAALPFVSIISLTFLYLETDNTKSVINLASSIFWFVLPTLSFFIFLVILLKYGVNFYISMITSIVLMSICYFIFAYILKKFNIII